MSCNWIQRAFDASRFTASGSMTWTVEAGDVATDAYVLDGKTVTYSFHIINTTTAGTASSELRLALPAQFSVARTMSNVIRLYDTTSGGYAGYAHVSPGVNYIRFTKLNADALPLITSGYGLNGQITFEIE